MGFLLSIISIIEKWPMPYKVITSDCLKIILEGHHIEIFKSLLIISVEGSCKGNDLRFMGILSLLGASNFSSLPIV